VIYADDCIIFGGNVHTVKEKAEALIVTSKEIGLDVIADKLSSWSGLEIRTQDEVTE